MPDGGFTADLEELKRHAEAVTTVSGRAVEAADAADQVADMDDAYGFLCRPIAWILKGPQDRVAECIGACSDALTATAKKVTDSVTTYQEVEDWIGQDMGTLLGELGSPDRRGVLTDEQDTLTDEQDVLTEQGGTIGERDGTIRGR